MLCELAARSGRREVCTEECPLWEEGACTLAELELDDAELDAWRADEPVAPLVVPPPS